MFETLSDRLGGIFDKLTRRGALSEADVDAAMREVRRALIEADVALEVVRGFIDRVKAEAVGQAVVKSVTPGQMVVKIVNDALVDVLGSDAEPINLSAAPPVTIMMVGLQGSGKTTSSAKIALRLKERERKKVLMASLDVRRPAAQEQLEILGQQIGVDTTEIIAGQNPYQITERAQKEARTGGYDVLILDTAGRLHIDEELMAENEKVAEIASPHEVLLVADALTGQDAVIMARAFDERFAVTGMMLTRVDGDGRGGAALSMRAVTGKPIKLIGTGEKIDALEEFHPDRIANRILGMGDVVSLVEKAAETIDAEEGGEDRPQDEEGDVRSGRPRGAIGADAEDRRHVRRARHAAGHRQDEEAARRQRSRQHHHQAPARDHFVHDQTSATGPAEDDECLTPQTACRRRLRHLTFRMSTGS